MLLLGLQGSPRKKGNTNYLLNLFASEAEKMGCRTEIIQADRPDLKPCIGCGFCEKKGRCAITDDAMAEVFTLFRKADVIVAASPIFFYGITAQLKAIIDRSQTLWSRKYVFKLADPAAHFRKGFLLSVGATKGKTLFDGVNLTTKYFFDAVGAEFTGSLLYRSIEGIGDMEKHTGVADDVEEAVKGLLTPLISRRKVMFACRENACRSQMAAAFTRYHAGERIEAFSGGSQPAEEVNPGMVRAMAEKGIDLAFHEPISIEQAVAEERPNMIVTMGCGETCPAVPGAEVIDWDLPDPAGESEDVMRNVRDEIEKRVVALVEDLAT